MNNDYAIYSYKFEPFKDEGELFRDERATPGTGSEQDVLYGLFMPKNNFFPVQEGVGDNAKTYTCEIFGNDSRIVALRLLNAKEAHYWGVVNSPHDPMGAVQKMSHPSTPCTYVIIDCRPGRNILAVKVEKEAWRNTDTVRDLMEESVNRQLKSLPGCGFRMKLYTKMEQRDFFEYSKERIKKEGRKVRKMTIHFKTGKLNPKTEAIIRGSDYLKQLFHLIDKYSLSGEMTLNQPIGQKLIDKRRHDIENIVALVGSDPLGYGLDMTFDDDVTLHCGKDTRAELPMVPEGALELFHIGQRGFPNKEPDLFEDKSKKQTGYLLEEWLDSVAEQTQKMKDAETIKQKRGRSNRRKAS